jgi:hypothetical protein
MMMTPLPPKETSLMGTTIESIHLSLAKIKIVYLDCFYGARVFLLPPPRETCLKFIKIWMHLNYYLVSKLDKYLICFIVPKEYIVEHVHICTCSVSLNRGMLAKKKTLQVVEANSYTG